MVSALRYNTIEVEVHEGPEDSPDAIFPNNTFSTHMTETGGGIFVAYPMATENRQAELTPELMATLSAPYKTIQDLRGLHARGLFLEGTGSLVLDREHKIAYALKSPRTDSDLTKTWAEIMGYTPEMFEALDEKGEPIYHTNVVMAVGSTIAVITPEVMPEKAEQERLTGSLTATNHEIMKITREQMNKFCGNIMEVQGKNGKNFFVMSQTAFEGFKLREINQLKRHCSDIISVEIPIIEKYGGGSARCMMAEIFQPQAL